MQHFTRIKKNLFKINKTLKSYVPLLLNDNFDRFCFLKKIFWFDPYHFKDCCVFCPLGLSHEKESCSLF